MLAHVVLATTAVIATPAGIAATEPATVVPVVVEVSPTPDPEPPPSTFNEFLPEERAIGDCISALPKPGCGSEARGGWRQGLILLAIVAGLAFIAWQVVRSARRARPDHEPSSPAGSV